MGWAEVAIVVAYAVVPALIIVAVVAIPFRLRREARRTRDQLDRIERRLEILEASRRTPRS